MTPPPTNPNPSSQSQPTKPALKIKVTPPAHIPLPPSDLTALVTAAIHARPSPRRNQPDFYFCDTDAQPVAPPPTPVEGMVKSLAEWRMMMTGDDRLTPAEGRSSLEGGRTSFDDSYSAGLSTPGSEKRVRFSFESIRDENDEDNEDVDDDAGIANGKNTGNGHSE